MRNVTLLASVASLALALAAPAAARAQARDTVRVHYPPAACPSCAAWNAPTAPARLFGDTYYVGTRGLTALLLTSDAGHLLLDAGLPASAEQVMANVRALGFRVEDIRLIVTSHVHYDHAGGVAAVQRASGAVVAASPASAAVLERGEAGPDDPQYGEALPFPAVAGPVRRVADGDTLRVGPIAIVAHFTPGHTPGGTSWSWRSCEAGECLDVVYADSQTPISADGFRFTDGRAYPTALQDFERGQARLARLRCDVLLTPHPGASRLWERLEARARAGAAALRDPEACRRYADAAREQLRRRIAAETGAR